MYSLISSAVKFSTQKKNLDVNLLFADKGASQKIRFTKYSKTETGTSIPSSNTMVIFIACTAFSIPSLNIFITHMKCWLRLSLVRSLVFITIVPFFTSSAYGP